MFCEKCGKQLLDNSQFCMNCGNKVTNEVKNNKNIIDKEVQLEIKPTFEPGYIIIPSLLFYGIIILISCVILWIDIEDVYISLIMFIISFLILVISIKVKLSITKDKYSNCIYEFYKTKVIYKDTFFNKYEKTIEYSNIKEITMSQDLIQRKYNIGSITLITNAEAGLENGMNMSNVKNVEDVCKQIKSLINI